MLEVPLAEVNRLAKLIPEGASLSQAMERVPRLREARREPQLGRLFECAERLEGLPRAIGTHAAGVVIAPGPLEDILPLYRDVDSRSADGAAGAGPVRRRTQYDMKDCEAVGLFKMDFLGLRALTHIEGLRPADRRGSARRKERGTARGAGPDPRAGHFEKVPARSGRLRALFGGGFRRDLPVREPGDAQPPLPLRAGEPR